MQSTVIPRQLCVAEKRDQHTFYVFIAMGWQNGGPGWGLVHCPAATDSNLGPAVQHDLVQPEQRINILQVAIQPTANLPSPTSAPAAFLYPTSWYSEIPSNKCLLKYVCPCLTNLKCSFLQLF